MCLPRAGISWVLNLLRSCWLKLLSIIKYYPQTKGKKCVKDVKDSCSNADGLVVPVAKGLPIVGTFFELIAAGAAPQLHKYIDKRHQQLGPIFRERLGGTHDAVFLASASLMRSVFLYEGQCPRHPLPDAWQLYNRTKNCQRGLFFMEGSEWLHNRRILNRIMLNGKLDWMDAHIAVCTEKFVASWRTKVNAQQNIQSFYEIVDLEAQLYRWAIDVICSIMFGTTAATDARITHALDAFASIVHQIFESSAALMSFPPQLAKFFNLKMWTRFERHVDEVLQQGASIIDMFLTLNESEEDITEDSDALLGMLQAAGMPLAMIKRIFVDLVVAAGDTTAYTTEWALYLLAKDAALQQRLAQDALSNSDADAGALVRGLIKETLRLYPVAPFIGRYLASDAIIDGYRIAKDTLVLLSLYTAGREEAHFPHPLHVKPERWQRHPETGELREVTEAHGTLPFAIGNRSCIGRRVASNQMHSLIAAIVSNFELRCTNPGPIDCVLRLITVPDQPLQLGIRLREEV